MDSPWSSLLQSIGGGGGSPAPTQSAYPTYPNSGNIGSGDVGVTPSIGAPQSSNAASIGGAPPQAPAQPQTPLGSLSPYSLRGEANSRNS